MDAFKRVTLTQSFYRLFFVFYLQAKAFHVCLLKKNVFNINRLTSMNFSCINNFRFCVVFRNFFKDSSRTSKLQYVVLNMSWYETWNANHCSKSMWMHAYAFDIFVFLFKIYVLVFAAIVVRLYYMYYVLFDVIFVICLPIKSKKYISTVAYTSLFWSTRRSQS